MSKQDSSRSLTEFGSIRFIIDPRFGGSLEDIDKVKQSLKGFDAYVRAAVQASVLLFDEACDKTKYRSLVWISIPTPPLVNVFYDSSPIVLFNQKNNPNKTTILDSIDSLIPGQIYTNDSLAVTALYLSKTRQWLTKLFSDYDSQNPEIPDEEIVEEIKGLFQFWDNWSPQAKLSLEKSTYIPRFSYESTPDELMEVFATHDPVLLNLLLFSLMHEQGHLIQTYDSVGNYALIASAQIILQELVKDLEYSKNAEYRNYHNMLLDDHNMMRMWVNETASDFFAILSLMQKRKREEVALAVAFLCLIQLLVELYSRNRGISLLNSHPSAGIRLIIIYRYIDRIKSFLGGFDISNYFDGAQTSLILIRQLIGYNE